MNRTHALLAQENRRFVLQNVLIIPTIMNLLVAYVLASLMFKPDTPVPIHGEHSVLIDLIMSSLFASIITGFIALLSTLSHCRAGNMLLDPLTDLTDLQRKLVHHPRKSMLLFSLLVFGLHILLINAIVHGLVSAETMNWDDFVLIKLMQAVYLSLLAASVGTWLATEYSARLDRVNQSRQE